MHAVSVRSYSRNSGSTSEDSVTGKPGWSPSTILADLALVAAVDVGVDEASP